MLGTTEKSAEIVEIAEIVAAIATETVIEVKEDDPDHPTIVPPDASMKQTLIPPAETTALANEKIDMVLGETNVSGIERGIPDVATTKDHLAEIVTCLMIDEVAAVQGWRWRR